MTGLVVLEVSGVGSDVTVLADGSLGDSVADVDVVSGAELAGLSGPDPSVAALLGLVPFPTPGSLLASVPVASAEAGTVDSGALEVVDGGPADSVTETAGLPDELGSVAEVAEAEGGGTAEHPGWPSWQSPFEDADGSATPGAEATVESSEQAINGSASSSEAKMDSDFMHGALSGRTKGVG